MLLTALGKVDKEDGLGSAVRTLFLGGRAGLGLAGLLGDESVSMASESM